MFTHRSVLFECVFSDTDVEVTFITLNAAVWWLALLIHIWKAPGSDLVPKSGNPDRFFVTFIIPSGMGCDRPQLLLLPSHFIYSHFAISYSMIGIMCC